MVVIATVVKGVVMYVVLATTDVELDVIFKGLTVVWIAVPFADNVLLLIGIEAFKGS